MSNGAFPDRVSQLRARWEADPTSRIFLQLAEEYRHQGRVKEALEVLERGLKEHPGYLSALVAKGRCYLELGEPQLARGVLERVVKQDATQMVANKLLVRAYLETGEPEKARERLDLYSLLNDSDPEIEDLRRRIKAAERSPDPDGTQPGTAAAPAVPADVFDLGLPTPVPAMARRPVEDVFQFEDVPPAPPVAPAGEELKPLAVVPTVEDPYAVPEVEALEVEAEEEVADGDLFPGLASRTTRERYLAALSAEGIFALDLPAEVSVALTAPPPASVFELEPEPELPEPAATVTLGDLYLRQGHVREAERIFREVLEREPGNAAAHQALDRMAGTPAREHRPLDARELLAGVQAGDPKTRKAFFLNRYLERIRQGSPRDVS